MHFSKFILAIILGVVVLGGVPACSHITNTEQVTLPKDIPLTRTRQDRIVSVAQSEFLFTTSFDVLEKLGFTVYEADRDQLTMVAEKTHNGNPITFHLQIVSYGPENVIKMETRYYGAYAPDYNEPYESYSAMMWDYVGQPFEQAY